MDILLPLVLDTFYQDYCKTTFIIAMHFVFIAGYFFNKTFYYYYSVLM